MATPPEGTGFLASLSAKNREALAQLCSANGIREDDLKQPEKIKSIEMVLDDYNCMETLSIFTNLKSICLIQQAIQKIEGLDSSPFLERLVLNENRIEEVEGLGSCTRLRHLHLSSNYIKELGDGLNGLHELEVFWIAENCLKSLKGIEMVANIKELNVARNEIEFIGGHLDRNTKLRILNLSDNHISGFDNVVDISKLASISDLAFSDPDWGENPICDLLNYQAFVLYHFPTLQILDRMRIADDEHSQAQVAFLRKQLYYNMRMKVCTRQALDTYRLCTGWRQDHSTAVRLELERAATVLRRFQGLRRFQAENPEDVVEALHKQELQVLPAVNTLDEHKATQHLREAEAELEDMSLLVDSVQNNVCLEEAALNRLLQFELHTAGNISLEPGIVGRDPWVKQVGDLVSARFRADDFTRFSIMDIKVQKVTRLHDRSSRIRFEGLLRSLEVEGMATQLEYLFLIPDPRTGSTHLQNMVQALERKSQSEETGSSGERSEEGGTEATPQCLMTNTVSLADWSHLEHFASSPSGEALGRLIRRGIVRQTTTNTAGGSLQCRGGSSSTSTASPSTSGATVLGAGLSPDVESLPKVPPACSAQLLLCSCLLGEQQQDDPQSFDLSRGPDIWSIWRRNPSKQKRKTEEIAANSAAPTATTGLTQRSAADLLAESMGGGVGGRGSGANDGEVPARSAPKAAQSIFRSRIGDPKQKVWAIPDRQTVLPEYLIDIDYVYASEFVQSKIEERRPELGPFTAYARDFCFATRTACTPNSSDEPRRPEPVTAQEEGEAAHAEHNHSDHRQDSSLPQVEYLNQSGLTAPQNKILGSIEAATLSNIKLLNLHGRGLRRMEADTLRCMPQLQTLLLSFNYIASMTSIAAVESLTDLDVSHNLIEKVSSLASLSHLKHLDISWNSFGVTAEVGDAHTALKDFTKVLSRDVVDLQVLEVRGNPITRSSWYRKLILSTLTTLRKLDGADILPHEVETAKEEVSKLQRWELSEDVLLDRSFCRRGNRRLMFELNSSDTERSRISNLLSMSGPVTAPWKPTGLTKSNWKNHVDRIDLKDMHLGDLCRLSSFVHLKRLDISGNRLTSLLKLSSCSALEELIVERNLLSSLVGVGELVELRHLDAGSNRICDVLELKKLTKLHQLSLEDNLVDSLDTFASLHSLVQLYLSNNLLEEVRSILLLKRLQKLLVLDLAGNELASATDARLYTMFHLKRLKVLDGIPISPQEQQAAEEKFSGRITMELLEDKLGPSPSCYNFRSVDLSNQNLRELGRLLNDDVFPSLRELNLNGNPFSDFRTVGPLSKLLVLKLNRTKIDLEKGMLGDADHIGGIGTLPHLQVLEVSQSGITDMSFFSNFPLQTLRILHLPGNEITKVEGLSHMEQLRELVLDKNKIKQVDEGAFDGLRCLRELRMDDNGLKSLTNLGPLPRLRALHLASNRIAELGELDKLRPLKHVVIVNLAQNPVARKPLYRAHLINAMSSARAIDGKEVSEEERERVEQMLQGGGPAPIGAAGCYVFTEQQQQQPAIPPQNSNIAYMHPNLGGGPNRWLPGTGSEQR